MSSIASGAVSAIVFYVADLARTGRFYHDVLHFDLGRMDGGADHPSLLTDDIGTLSIVFIENPEKSPGRSPIVVFGLDGGIEDAVDALVRQNVEIVVPLSEAPDGGLSVDFADPDGHTLSFHQPAEGSA